MRFKGVSNAKRLEVKLDNINDQKFVNLPRFARQTQIQALKQKVINRWEPSKEFCKPLKKTNRPTLRSYAEVTIKGNIQGGKTKREDIPPTISITPHEGRGYWCNNAWVGKLKKAMAVERMEDRIAWDLGYNFFFVPHYPEALRYAKVWGKDVVRSLTLAYAKRLFPDSNP